MLQLQCSKTLSMSRSSPDNVFTCTHFIFWPQLTAHANSVYIWLVKSLILYVVYLDCIQWPRLNMLVDAEIYITVYIISSLVLKPPPLLPFNCIHNSTQKRKIVKNNSLPCIVNANRRSGNKVRVRVRLLSSFWDIVSGPNQPQCGCTFSILGTRLAFSPTLTLHWQLCYCQHT